MSPSDQAPSQPGYANESWFSRWRRLRDQDPDSPLDVLLSTEGEIHADPLIDIACMDLIEQRRGGRPACVEDYLRAFPSLDNQSQRLDLIDAEICVRDELRCPLSVREWTARFPNDHDAISSLIKMDDGAAQPEMLVRHRVRQDEASTPDWFVGQKVFASGPGWWIVRGIHRETHATYALKIIGLPSTVSPSQVQRLSEVVSQCSQANHPNWVAAESSTIHNGHLGVLRPWVHGVAWHDQPGDTRTIVRRLANVAMLLAGTSAARLQHGGVHAGNLWIDHRGQVMLMDAGSSRRGIRRWLTGSSGEFMSAPQRATWDCEEFKSLIAATLMRSPEPLVDTILQGIRDPDLTPLSLGELLFDAADGKRIHTDNKGMNLRARLSHFISRDARRPS